MVSNSSGSPDATILAATKAGTAICKRCIRWCAHAFARICSPHLPCSQARLQASQTSLAVSSQPASQTSQQLQPARPQQASQTIPANYLCLTPACEKVLPVAVLHLPRCARLQVSPARSCKHVHESVRTLPYIAPLTAEQRSHIHSYIHIVAHIF